MQIGIDHEEAEEFAEKNGLKVITNKCLMIEHKRMWKKREIDLFFYFFGIA